MGERFNCHSCFRANTYLAEQKQRLGHRGAEILTKPPRNVSHHLQQWARILVHGKDRQDRLGSEDNIRLKVWHFRRVPIFRVAEGRDYIDGKAVKAQHEIARLSFCIARTKGLNHDAGSNQKALSPAAN